MDKKDKITYAAIIAILAVSLGVLWFLIIDAVNSGIANDDMPAINSDSSSISYSAVKEITSDEDITDGEFSSTDANQNVISASGSLKSTLSDIAIFKTGDSNGGDSQILGIHCAATSSHNAAGIIFVCSNRRVGNVYRCTVG